MSKPVIFIANHDPDVRTSWERFWKFKGYETITAPLLEEVCWHVKVDSVPVKYVLAPCCDTNGQEVDQDHAIYDAVKYWFSCLKPTTPPKIIWKVVALWSPQRDRNLYKELIEAAEKPDILPEWHIQFERYASVLESFDHRLSRIEEEIHKRYLSEHDQPNFEMAKSTQGFRYQAYALSIALLAHFNTRILILDNRWQTLRNVFQELGIPTAMMEDVEKDSNKLVYFVHFERFHTKIKERSQLRDDRKKWQQAVSELLYKKGMNFNQPARQRRSGSYPFDAIVLDIHLDRDEKEAESGPQKALEQYDGIDILEATREKFAGIPIVMLTAFHNEWHIIRAIHAGADGYVHKYKYPIPGKDYNNSISRLQLLRESVRDIFFVIARLYMRRFRLQQIFVELSDLVNKALDSDVREAGRVINCIHVKLAKQRQETPSFLGVFFEHLTKITKELKRILETGCPYEDWVEVKQAGEAIRQAAEDIINSPHNVLCFPDERTYNDHLSNDKVSARSRLIAQCVQPERQDLATCILTSVQSILREANRSIRKFDMRPRRGILDE